MSGVSCCLHVFSVSASNRRQKKGAYISKRPLHFILPENHNYELHSAISKVRKLPANWMKNRKQFFPPCGKPRATRFKTKVGQKKLRSLLWLCSRKINCEERGQEVKKWQDGLAYRNTEGLAGPIFHTLDMWCQAYSDFEPCPNERWTSLNLKVECWNFSVQPPPWPKQTSISGPHFWKWAKEACRLVSPVRSALLCIKKTDNVTREKTAVISASTQWVSSEQTNACGPICSQQANLCKRLPVWARNASQ